MRIGLFVPCYIDAFFPEVGIATLELLERLGHEVVYPRDQTCCGQPMANSGFNTDCADTESLFVRNFSGFDYGPTNAAWAPCVLRDAPLPGAPQDEVGLPGVSKSQPHPEEPAQRASRRTHGPSPDNARTGHPIRRRSSSTLGRAPARRPPRWSATRISAICTALSAAPLRRLSATIHKLSPCCTVGSRRMRLT